jgi:hypothetical protein
MTDSQQTPSRFPADTQQTPSRCHVDTGHRRRRQSPRNLGVFRGVDLRTIAGRRIRFLYPRYLEQAELDDGNVVHQAAALKVAKLTVILERLQNESLKCKKYSRRLGSELVRLENLLRRAKLELVALKPRELTWWEQRQLEKQEENDES